MFFTVLEKAIVYGCTLDAYCCVQTLIAMGIPGENIQLVEPPAIYQVLFDHVIESLFSKMFYHIIFEFFYYRFLLFKVFCFFFQIVVNLFQWPQDWWCCKASYGGLWSASAFWVHSGPVEWREWCDWNQFCKFYIQ